MSGLLPYVIRRPTITTAGESVQVHFNPSKGLIPRIWGLFASFAPGGAIGAFFQATIAFRRGLPADTGTGGVGLLWFYHWQQQRYEPAALNTTHVFSKYQDQIIFPIPVRERKLTVTVNGEATVSAPWIAIVYYDLDKMLPGEETSILEKSVLKGVRRVG